MILTPRSCARWYGFAPDPCHYKGHAKRLKDGKTYSIAGLQVLTASALSPRMNRSVLIKHETSDPLDPQIEMQLGGAFKRWQEGVVDVDGVCSMPPAEVWREHLRTVSSIAHFILSLQCNIRA